MGRLHVLPVLSCWPTVSPQRQIWHVLPTLHLSAVLLLHGMAQGDCLVFIRNAGISTSHYAIVDATSAVMKWFVLNISEPTSASNFQIYSRVALDSLYTSTENDFASYFQSTASRINLSYFGSCSGCDILIKKLTDLDGVKSFGNGDSGCFIFCSVKVLIHDPSLMATSDRRYIQEPAVILFFFKGLCWRSMYFKLTTGTSDSK